MKQADAPESNKLIVFMFSRPTEIGIVKDRAGREER